MDLAIRSFTFHSGLKLSIFANTVAVQPEVIRRNLTSGVLPMHWVTSSRTCCIVIRLL